MGIEVTAIDAPSSSLKNGLFRNCAPVRRVLPVVILLGTILRLFHIEGPPNDHHWFRQYDTAAIARNYAEGSMAFLYPQVDWRGESPGYVESEFPAYSYLVALLYRAWEPQEWLARALNIVLYIFSAVVFFFFTRRMFDERAALFALVLFVSSAELLLYPHDSAGRDGSLWHYSRHLFSGTGRRIARLPV